MESTRPFFSRGGICEGSIDKITNDRGKVFIFPGVGEMPQSRRLKNGDGQPIPQLWQGMIL
jgi:hypothetical protein